jgi:hypothetical protein
VIDAVRLPVPSAVRLARRDAVLTALGWVLLLVPLAGALGLSLWVSPDDIEAGRILLSPECTMKRLLGHGCPTCGLTRAFCALGHGELARALDYHVASPLVYALFWIGAALTAVRLAGTMALLQRLRRAE